MKKILITGTAGFIGFHLAERLVKQFPDDQIVGLDNINDYYDVSLKFARLNESGIYKEAIDYNIYVQSQKYPNYRFIKLNLEDREKIRALFDSEKFSIVIHLAAQAGVRYSLKNPHAYIDSNITGFLNILEGCRHNPPEHLIFASSSSVYGANKKMPFSVHDHTDHPLSLYGATKKSNELMAHAYSNLFHIPCTGLRFFTVYGPWGRPDMAMYLFAKLIIERKPIKIYNSGKMQRDFTYIDDVIEGTSRLINKPPLKNDHWDPYNPDPASSFCRFKIFNIGNNSPVEVSHILELIERYLGQKAEKDLLPIQPGDVPATMADVDDLWDYVNFKPSTSIEVGVENFINWFKKYHSI
ncbi:MAG: NAD-dependent epimerase [Candidatus Saccharicenans sp.]|nr:NAD-dependent epimerase [Candidatus Saccharicenans sp.]